MNSNIFINYRTEDAAQAAGRLYERLTLDLPRDNVFFDIQKIEGGGDIRKRIDEALDTCVAILVVIGPRWLAPIDAAGNRRIDDERDWVRYEITRALEKDVQVIPVLVDEATLPQASDFPPALACLRDRLARQIRHSRFQSDADDLKREIIQIIFSQIQKNTVRRKPSEHGQVAQPVQQLSTAVAAALEAAHSAFAATLSSAINPPREASAGIATGFRELDQYLGGLRQGDMLVIAGPAGIGKTALARGIALNVAQTLLDETKPDHIGPPCAYFTMQETAEDQATRILTALCEISEERIRRGMIEEADFARLVTASQRMANMPLYFDQAKDLSFSQLCTNVQRLAERHKGISLAVIDSLEALLRPPGNGWSEIAFALKGLAANLASPLIVVVRTTASQQFSQKGLEALGEFRDIGLAADKVLFLQGAGYSLLAERPPADNEEAYSAWLRDWEATRGLSEIFVSKNAGGKTGTVAIRFDGAINRYQDL